ncbi:hypothetical protein [Haladaptatus sp. R4]|uniref:DUF7266 family protein n=1 Tax=Haladaptatus sp. R4 TaxID=1679489 RepID=UPI000B2656B1|nr:hypothetical protein [Haladaptatus sp. R4]
MMDARRRRTNEKHRSRETDRRFRDDRAVSPVIGKALEAGLVVLYIGLLTTTLYSGAVPKYRAAVGHEVGDRVLSKTAERVQQSVPADGTNVDVRMRVSLPETIHGHEYVIRANGRTLTLHRSDDGSNSSVRLSLPSRVATVRGHWSSYDPAIIAVHGGPDGLIVELKRGKRGTNR